MRLRPTVTGRHELATNETLRPACNPLSATPAVGNGTAWYIIQDDRNHGWIEAKMSRESLQCDWFVRLSSIRRSVHLLEGAFLMRKENCELRLPSQEADHIHHPAGCRPSCVGEVRREGCKRRPTLKKLIRLPISQPDIRNHKSRCEMIDRVIRLQRHLRLRKLWSIHWISC
jgi:hypothetical protein